MAIGEIFILFEKHGDRYLDATDKQILYKRCLEIVNDRYKEGWYDDISTPITEPTKPEPLSDFDKQPQYAQEAFSKLEFKYKKNVSEYVQLKYQQRLLEEALQDGEKAFKFLVNRSNAGYEYECCEVVDVES